MLFGKKKKQSKTYDPSVRKPVIRASICTGEKTAGFKNLKTGAFEEVTIIRSPDDLAAFKEEYGITDEIETIY